MISPIYTEVPCATIQLELYKSSVWHLRESCASPADGYCIVIVHTSQRAITGGSMLSASNHLHLSRVQSTEPRLDVQRITAMYSVGAGCTVKNINRASF